MKPPIKISVLVAARRNSKYLSKFLFGYFERTHDLENTELLVMLNEHDDWNNELVTFFSSRGVRFFRENKRLGRAGLHEYFNDLYKKADGDWIVYFCEDHFIIMDNWDAYVRNSIEKLELDSRKVWSLIPKFDNVGAMNQILSRGYCQALGGLLGRHGWIDSYINDLNAGIPADRVLRFDHEMFHDFTHDHPSPMSESHMQSVNTDRGNMLPAYDSERTKILIKEDQGKLIAYIEREGKNGL